MIKLNISPAPYPGAPVVVLSAGLGGAGGYWLAQRAVLTRVSCVRISGLSFGTVVPGP